MKKELRSGRDTLVPNIVSLFLSHMFCKCCGPCGVSHMQKSNIFRINIQIEVIPACHKIRFVFKLSKLRSLIETITKRSTHLSYGKKLKDGAWTNVYLHLHCTVCKAFSLVLLLLTSCVIETEVECACEREH